MILTSKVRMEHVDRHWKAYPAGNKGESPEWNAEQKSTSGCLKKKCVAVNMDKSKNCMPRDSKDHEVEPAIMRKRSSRKR